MSNIYFNVQPCSKASIGLVLAANIIYKLVSGYQCWFEDRRTDEIGAKGRRELAQMRIDHWTID